MIRLISYNQAFTLVKELPPLALLRMQQLEGSDGNYDPESHGYIIVLQDHDDPFAIPEIGEDPFFELVSLEEERDGSKTYEATIAIDDERMIGVIWREETNLPLSFLRLIQAG